MNVIRSEKHVKGNGFTMKSMFFASFRKNNMPKVIVDAGVTVAPFEKPANQLPWFEGGPAPNQRRRCRQRHRKS